MPPRQCAPGCHCLHCKDQDAWLDVADSLKLTDEQKCKIMLSRSVQCCKSCSQYQYCMGIASGLHQYCTSIANEFVH